IGGLTPSTEYTDYQVVAVDLAGNISLAATVSFTTEASSAFIEGPSNLKVTVSENTATVSFDPAVGTEIEEPIEYTIVVTKNEDSSVVFKKEHITKTEYRVTGLEYGKEYTVTVTAKDIAGVTGTEQSYSFKTPTSLEDDSAWGDVLPQDRVGLTEVPNGIWTAGMEVLYYTGAKQTQEFRVYDGNVMLKEGTDYTVSYKNNINAGAASGTDFDKTKPYVTVKMKGNYTGSQNINFVIKPQPLKDDNGVPVVTAEAITTVKGAKVPNPVVYWNGKALKVKKDFTFTPNYSEGASKDVPGEYTITIKGENNFSGEITIDYVVSETLVSLNKASIKLAKDAKKVPWNENGAEITKDQLTVKVGKDTLTKDDYDVTFDNNDKVGTAYVIVTGKGKFSGSKRAAFSVTGVAMKDVTVTVPGSVTYGGEAIELEDLENVNITYGGEKLVEDEDFTATYKNNNKQGTATITLTGKAEAGFTGSKKVTFSIAKAKLSNDMLLKVGDTVLSSFEEELSVPFTQGGTKPAVIVETADGRELVAGTDYTVSYKNNTKVYSENNTKPAEIIIKAKGNYDGQIVKTFKIVANDAADGELSVVVNDKAVKAKRKKKDWMSTFKVMDISGKALSKKDYNAVAEYTVKKSVDEKYPEGYKIEDADTIPVGTKVQVKVTLKDPNYTGVVTGEYTILADNYDISKAKIKIEPQKYTGGDIELEDKDITIAVAKLGKTDLELDKDYEIVAYSNNVNKGTAKVTLRGKEDFGGEKTVTFKIVQRDANTNWLINLLLNLQK
ncbi:MAG: fibronectin type III domain-containing protein, partial [Lachnospiraceae bacterium]|nr:fibronectin type III domain-containing protein [Lachnospiraceae bacterium]